MIPDIIEEVANHAVAKNFLEARKLLLAGLNYETIANERNQLLSSIWSPSKKPSARRSNKAKRAGVSNRLMLQVFHRDKFTCRYLHCQRRTIYIPVLRELSRLFPDLLAYHPNWKPMADHLLYWVYSTSLEHKLSFPHGGDSAETNLITACYCCNDAKSYLHLDELAWEITDPSESDWGWFRAILTSARKDSGSRHGTSVTKSSSPKTVSQYRQVQIVDPSSIVVGSLMRARLQERSSRPYRVDHMFLAPKTQTDLPRQSSGDTIDDGRPSATSPEG